MLHAHAKFRFRLATRLAALFVVVSLPGILRAQESKNEQALWKLEHDYWVYVQKNDLVGYRALWHKDFLGWPSVSATPVRKDHITDWITSETAQGLTFQPGELKQAAIQITGNLGTTTYWMTSTWAGKDGKGETRTTRIIHTWLKEGDTWHIISGMSMPVPAPPAN